MRGGSLNKKTYSIEEIIAKSKIGERIQLKEALREESDRGSALLAVSYLENELENAIRRMLVEGEVCDKVIRRTLSNFESKIDMAYVLGIISSQQMENIKKIKNIRNSFGHSYTKLGFDNDEIKRQCIKLRYKYEDYIDDATIRDIFILNVDKEIDSIIKISKAIKRIDEKEDVESTEESHIKIEASRDDFYLFFSEICKELDKYSSKKYYAEILENDKIMDALYKYYCERSNEI